MEDNSRVGNNLEMCSCGRNENPIVVVVYKYFKSFLCDDGEEHNEQVKDHLVANQETTKILAKNDSHDEIFGKDEGYPKRKRHPFGEE